MKTLVSLVVVCAIVLIGAPFASACAPGAGCHGTINWVSAPITWTGGLATVNATTITVPAPATTFLNHEMWVTTNNSTSGVGATWVEEGIKYGTENGLTSEGLILFWAEWNTSLQYGWHKIGIAGTSTNYNVKISYSGSDSWGVYLNGNQIGGTSHSQPCCAGRLAVGGETTAASPTLNATGTNLQKRNASNSWSYNWGGGPYWDGPGNTFNPFWTTTGLHMGVTA